MRQNKIWQQPVKIVFKPKKPTRHKGEHYTTLCIAVYTVDHHQYSPSGKRHSFTPLPRVLASNSSQLRAIIH